MRLWLRVVSLCASVWLGAAVVHVSQGSLRGAVLVTRGGRRVYAFTGIPYAAPPVGPLRFHKPLPVDSWDGERDATTPGSACLQSNHSSKGEVFGSEDCLYLNVYTHQITNESTSPVLVFIHGGDFQEGWSQHYQPDFLMDKDIVLVTINYRLGVLGFLSLEDKELPGNNGLKDQRAALVWVRDNIAQFGGDASAMTLCGEGAGAASIHLHMLSPLSQGLFHRAIAQSGSAYCPWATHPAGQAQTAGERFAAQLGCNHHSTNDTLDCLRAMPAYILVDIAQGMHEWHLDPVVIFGPTVEPADTEEPFLLKDPWQLSSDIPWIAGFTSAEGISKTMLFDSTKIIELNEDFEFYGPLTLLFRATAENAVHTAFTVKKFYFLDGDIKPDNLEGLTNMYSDAWFVYPIKEALRRHRGSKYFYYFDYKGANSLVPNSQGVGHFEDLQYFFPMKSHFTSFNVSEEDRNVSEKLIELWTNFVIQGEPSLNTSDIVWADSSTTTHTENYSYLHIKNGGFTMEKDLLQERDSFWSGLQYREKFEFDHRHNKIKDEL